MSVAVISALKGSKPEVARFVKTGEEAKWRGPRENEGLGTIWRLAIATIHCPCSARR